MKFNLSAFQYYPCYLVSISPCFSTNSLLKIITRLLVFIAFIKFYSSRYSINEDANSESTLSTKYEQENNSLTLDKLLIIEFVLNEVLMLLIVLIVILLVLLILINLNNVYNKVNWTIAANYINNSFNYFIFFV